MFRNISRLDNDPRQQKRGLAHLTKVGSGCLAVVSASSLQAGTRSGSSASSISFSRMLVVATSPCSSVKSWVTTHRGSHQLTIVFPQFSQHVLWRHAESASLSSER